MAKIPTGLTGAAGEYHVAAELSRRNWLATVTIKNAPGTDVLAQRIGGGRTIAIQTKTANPGPRHFQLSKKDERPSLGPGPSEWYLFVGLRAVDARPDFYVVPRDVVAAIVYLEHREWLNRKGYEKSPTSMRIIKRSWIDPWREGWDRLEREISRKCPLHESFFAAAKRYGWPDGLSGLTMSKRGPKGGPLEHRMRPG